MLEISYMIDSRDSVSAYNDSVLNLRKYAKGIQVKFSNSYFEIPIEFADCWINAYKFSNIVYMSLVNNRLCTPQYANFLLHGFTGYNMVSALSLDASEHLFKMIKGVANADKRLTIGSKGQYKGRVSEIDQSNSQYLVCFNSTFICRLNVYNNFLTGRVNNSNNLNLYICTRLTPSNAMLVRVDGKKKLCVATLALRNCLAYGDEMIANVVLNGDATKLVDIVRLKPAEWIFNISLDLNSIKGVNQAMSRLSKITNFFDSVFVSSSAEEVRSILQDLKTCINHAISVYTSSTSSALTEYAIACAFMYAIQFDLSSANKLINSALYYGDILNLKMAYIEQCVDLYSDMVTLSMALNGYSDVESLKV